MTAAVPSSYAALGFPATPACSAGGFPAAPLVRHVDRCRHRGRRHGSPKLRHLPYWYDERGWRETVYVLGMVHSATNAIGAAGSAYILTNGATGESGVG
jgi:hypothetical protein